MRRCTVDQRVLDFVRELGHDPEAAVGIYGGEESAMQDIAIAYVPCPERNRYERHADCRVGITVEWTGHFWEADGEAFEVEPTGLDNPDSEFTPYRHDFVPRVRRWLAPWKELETVRAMAEAERNLPWIWQGFLLPGAVTLFSSRPKVGKTTLVYDLMEAIETMPRGEFLGARTELSHILYITEEGPVTLLRRIDGGPYRMLKVTNNVHYVTASPDLDWSRVLNIIDRAVVEVHWQPGVFLPTDPFLIILDTLSFFMEVSDENDAAQVRQALKPIVDRARKYNVAILLVHHSRKSGGSYGEGVRGSSAFTGNVDIVMELMRPSRPNAPDDERRLECIGRYAETPTEPLVLRWDDAGYHAVRPGAEDRGGQFDEKVLLTKAVNPTWSLQRIAIAAGCSKTEVWRVLQRHGIETARGEDATD